MKRPALLICTALLLAPAAQAQVRTEPPPTTEAGKIRLQNLARCSGFDADAGIAACTILTN